MSAQKYYGKKFQRVERQIAKFSKFSGKLSQKDMEEIEEIQGEIERLTAKNFQARDFLEEKLTNALVVSN